MERCPSMLNQKLVKIIPQIKMDRLLVQVRKNRRFKRKKEQLVTHILS